MHTMLRDTFIALTERYDADTVLAAELWQEIETAYTHRKRHYHTLDHLDNLMQQLTAVKEQIGEWDTLLFSIYYHDVVYNVLKHDNEEESAVLAEQRMRQLDVPEAQVTRCKEQILATKSHVAGANNDTNLFTDADLSVLGHEWERYAEYCYNVRREYSIYPDIMYKPGRKKVLKHFLGMERIYKTPHFYDLYEARARENMARELEGLL